jgi:hypothetical protein
LKLPKAPSKERQMSRPRLVVTLVVGILILNGLAVPANAAVTCYGEQPRFWELRATTP